MKANEVNYYKETLKRIKEICEGAIWDATAHITGDDDDIAVQQEVDLWNAIDDIYHLLEHIDDESGVAK